MADIKQLDQPASPQGSLGGPSRGSTGFVEVPADSPVLVSPMNSVRIIGAVSPQIMQQPSYQAAIAAARATMDVPHQDPEKILEEFFNGFDLEKIATLAPQSGIIEANRSDAIKELITLKKEFYSLNFVGKFEVAEIQTKFADFIDDLPKKTLAYIKGNIKTLKNQLAATKAATPRP